MATSWRRNPLIYEINTWTWLHALTRQHGQRITLGSVPDAALDELAAWSFDAVWLMGVWERSPRGRQIAREHPDLQAEFHRALPDFAPDDVIGSPYAVHRYDVDPHLGTRAELVALRQRLAARGLKLVLDYVPNHVAVDHPWLESCPDCFMQGSEDDMAENPGFFFRGEGRSGARIFAHGRDPYFPAWTDTAQLNAFSPSLRERTANTLLSIASLCDAVRCDMAMLVTNKVFTQTWGSRAGRVPDADFWTVVIPAVKAQNPHVTFMAEVYWDMEWDLQQQGFDYTYDKRLYDRLENHSAGAILAHLRADLDYQNRMVRFIENHDEPRATAALGPGRDLAAAVLIATLPGAVLLHEGQMAGHQVRVPVQLDRRPPEPDNDQVTTFYRMLLAEANHPIYHDGDWRLRGTAAAWDLNASHVNLIPYTWEHGDERRLVVVNYSATGSQGWIDLGDFGLAGMTWLLDDVLNLHTYERDGHEMTYEGLYVDLKPWQAHIFTFRPR